jgi:D-alanine-D-alanine ligase
VSVLTGLQAVHELARAGRAVTGLYWSKTGDWFEIDPALEASSFVEGVPRGAQALQLVSGPEGGFLPAQKQRGLLGGSSARGKALQLDVVVNCCHGGPGEDGSLQGALDLAGIRYTGPNVAGAAIGMDKLGFAAVAGHAGLPVLPRVMLDKETSADQLGFSAPFIVKPRFGGSSIGIEVVADLDSAKALLNASPHLQRGAVLEPYRGDLFDLNVAARTWPSLELSAVERPERTTIGAEILGYADKYVGAEGMASAPRELPAYIPEDLRERLCEVARHVARLVGVRGIARVDFLSDGSGELWLNEVNTIPGGVAR